jgi:SH3-like domain-containing protein
MTTRVLMAGVSGLALLASAPVQALDYRSVSQAAPLYDAPSAKSRPLFVIMAGTPVEQVVAIEGWSKVRDAKGDLLWIEKKYLSEKRTVIVRAERAQVLAKAEDKAALAFEADKDVVLDLLETLPEGWLKVARRDGQSGYVRTTQVWGR